MDFLCRYFGSIWLPYNRDTIFPLRLFTAEHQHTGAAMSVIIDEMNVTQEHSENAGTVDEPGTSTSPGLSSRELEAVLRRRYERELRILAH